LLLTCSRGKAAGSNHTMDDKGPPQLAAFLFFVDQLAAASEWPKALNWTVSLQRMSLFMARS
jgi:hypothetical protein